MLFKSRFELENNWFSSHKGEVLSLIPSFTCSWNSKYLENHCPENIHTGPLYWVGNSLLGMGGSCRLHNFQIKLCRKQSAKFGCPVRYEYIFLNLTQIRNFLFLELCLFQKSFGQISHFPCTTFQENTDFPSRFRTHLSSKYQHELPLTSVGLEQERTAWYGWTLGPILPTPTRSWATEQPTQTLGLTNINSFYFNDFLKALP